MNPEAGADLSADKREPIAADLRTRVGSAVVLAAIALVGIYLGGIWMALIVGAAAAIVHLEWSHVTGGGLQRAIPLTAAVVLATLAAGLGYVALALAIVALAILAGALVGREPWRPAGVLYAAALGVSLVALRIASDLGAVAIVFLFAVVWATDTGAYFAGRLIGGPRLAPRISPKKTWAGAIGGLVAALLAGLAVAGLSDGVGVTPVLAIVAIALSLASQVGDFFESWVKRRFGVKDASHLIPGHGGMMDRVDGLTFASVVAAVIGLAHAGPQGLARGLLSW